MTEQYETLRTAALGGRLPLEARNGLTLFVRRGMWAWARAATPRSPTGPTPPSVPRTTDDDGERAIVHLFAALAMRATERMIHERFA